MKTIALAGNPNVGKSTVFNALTGLKQHTGNWTGKTVEVAFGEYKKGNSIYKIVDLPGTYSLVSHSDEEVIAEKFIKSGEAQSIIVICDATALERNLILALQILEINKNVVLCVNLIDEAKKKKINIDTKKLSELLSVPVVPCSARSKQGIDELITTAINCCENAHEMAHQNPDTNSDTNIEEIVNRAEFIAKSVTSYGKSYSGGDKADRIITSRRFGYPIMIALLALVLYITISFANYPSEFLSELFSKLEVCSYNAMTSISLPHWLVDIVTNGIIRVTGWVISVMLPPMAIFFPLFTILEDAGYLPRIAFNLDNSFKRCCACGKQALTMCMGFGCNAVGVTGCRIIDSKRERLIAAITNVFVPCNGRFPILISIISMFFVLSGGFLGSFISALLLTIVIISGIAITFFVSRILSKTVLKGVPSSFTLELPPYRMPQFGKVIVRSLLDRTLFVLLRAVAVALPASIVIWVMANVSIDGNTLLYICSNAIDPFARAIGLDGVILLAFILGSPANEIVFPLIIMAYSQGNGIMELESLESLKTLLVSNGWTYITAISTMLFALMHWPCTTTLITTYKETKSVKWTFASFIIPTVVGLIVCFIVTNILRIF